jgi:putative ABC transport system permease protein
MLENFVKIAWRNLLREKLFSVIKIGGFAIGIAACLIIGLFIWQELTYDSHYADQDKIFRVLRASTFKGERSYNVHFPAPFAQALVNDFADFEKAGRYNLTPFFGAVANEIRRTDADESIHEDGFIYMDQSLLDILRPQFVAGRPDEALTAANSIVITKRKASKFFSNEDPLGKTFILNNDEKRLYTVTGVMDDLPVTSHLQYDFIMTLAGKEFYEGEQSNWINSNYPTYVRLRPGVDRGTVEQKISSVAGKYFLAQARESGEISAVEWAKSLSFRLQPLDEIYLNLNNIQDGLSHGDVRYIWLFGGIAIFILVIAGINFVNLSTARSAKRVKEVGLRKAVGSTRSGLIRQFLTESIVVSLLSFTAAMVLTVLALRSFSALFGKSLLFPWHSWWLVPLLAVCALGVGLVAGLYPSFYLSSFRPSDVLKGTKVGGSRNPALRNALVVFQFTVSVALIAGTLLISQQMTFMLNKKLGFDKEQILILQGTHTLNEDITTFKNELLRVPGIKSATISGYLPVEGTKRNQNQFSIDGEPRVMEETVAAQRWTVDHDYLTTLGLKLIKGRAFSEEIHSDSQAFVINASMAKELNLEDPVGKVITNGYFRFPVIGVIEDFHYQSLRENIEPLCLQIGRSADQIAVKISTSDLPGLIGAISTVWRQFSVHQPIRYSFLDQDYERMYDDVLRMGNIFRSFAVLAIVIACLGLFALTTYMVEHRSKEISIRLVLGASVSNILRLLTINFVVLVLISIALATPLSLYLMQEWLNEFAYRIHIGWQLFAVAGGMSLLIALMTIGFQCLRAANANPMTSLREQ